MKYGYRIVEDLKSGLALYMNRICFKSVREMVGLGLSAVEVRCRKQDAVKGKRGRRKMQ